MERKTLQFKADVNEQGIFTGHAGAFGNVDEAGDILEKGAAAKSIASGKASRKLKIFPQHQDFGDPIGKTLEISEDGDGILVKGYISPTSRGSDYRQLIKDGVLDEMSIGYEVIKSDTDEKGIRHLREIELIEISIVNYPANPEARIQNYKGGSTPMGEENKKEEKKDVKKEAKADGQVVLTPEELQTLVTEAAQAGAAEALKAMMPPEGDPEDENKGDETKGDNPDKETKSETKNAPADIQRKYSGIYMNRNAENPLEQKSDMPAGIGFVRYQKCMFRAKGDYTKAADIASKEYNNKHLTTQIKAMNVTTPSEGGFLVPEMYASEIIELLRPKSILLSLGITELPMDAGNINIPKATQSASASYVGELRKGKKSAAKYGNLRMSSKKLLSLVPVSNDLMRSNKYGADNLILKDVTTVMGLAMDKAGLIGTGDEYTPLGIFRNPNVPTVPISAAPSETTSGLLIGKLLENNADTTSLGWAINSFAWKAFYNAVNAVSGLYTFRDEMKGGKLDGHKFEVSNQIPRSSAANNPTDVMLGDWSEMMIGRQGQMETEFLRESSYTDDNGVVHNPAEEDFTLIRCLDLHDFGVRHEESFVKGTALSTP